MKKILAVIGILVGGFIGFLLRPSLLLVGQLPFEKVILAGTNLKGVDQFFVKTAQTSFLYMVLGAVGGLVIGLILAAVMTGKQK
jgi:ABC-type Fe3+ transport system permease subunit